MIYIGNVRPSIMDKPINKSAVEFFRSYKPDSIACPDDVNEYDTLKQFKISGFIAGEMSKLSRKDENVLYRDCLILDLDDVKVSEDEMLDVFKQKFSSFDYIAYPSFGYGQKGIRYRLVLSLDRNVIKDEYKRLIEFFSTVILSEVIGEADQSNATWSQIQLLPVITQYVTEDKIIINETGKSLPVSECLKSADKLLENNTKAMKIDYKNAGTRYRTSTTDLFESLVRGCSEGNRNNTITKITGGLLVRSVNVGLALELVKFANNNFTIPLDEDELEKTFISIARKELGAD